MNFNNQWIEIFRTGSHLDDAGRSHEIDANFLESVVNNFDAAVHTPPLVVGHPRNDAPAYGWVDELRARGARLEVRVRDTDPSFEEMVSAGRFRKRSASFYVEPSTAPGGRAPALRHVGFLGAQPPAVKGLRDIQFTEARAVTFEFTETTMEREIDSVVERVWEKLKAAFGGKKDSTFAEADLEAAVREATSSFREELASRDAAIRDLRARVDTASNRATRAELVSFIDSLGSERCPPAFRRQGIVEFMESLLSADRKVVVIDFAEKDGQRVETRTESSPLEWFKSFISHLGPFIEFGERFHGLPTEPPREVTPERMAELREKAGLPAQGGK